MGQPHFDEKRHPAEVAWCVLEGESLGGFGCRQRGGSVAAKARRAVCRAAKEVSAAKHPSFQGYHPEPFTGTAT